MSAAAPPGDQPDRDHADVVRVPTAQPAAYSPPAASSAAPSWGVAWLGAAIALLLLAGAFPTCAFKLAVGAPCPGCGLTRATLALLRLDLAEVWRLHPLAPLVSPLFGWLLLRPLAVRIGWVSPEAGLLRGRALTVVIVSVVLAMWILYVARLAGALGGHPDPVSLRDGWLTRWWF